MTLPKWLTDIVFNILLPIAKSSGKKAVVDWLNNFKVKEPNWYATIVIVGYRMLVVHLKPIADDTKTPYDNEANDVVIDALKESAAANGVSLPDITIIPKPALPAP